MASSLKLAWEDKRFPPTGTSPVTQSQIKPINPFIIRGRAVEGAQFFDLASLLAFCFPDDEAFPLSTGRLILFAHYGPLDADGALRGGRGCGRPLLPFEVDAMVAEIEAEDVLDAFNCGRFKCATHVELKLAGLGRRTQLGSNPTSLSPELTTSTLMLKRDKRPRRMSLTSIPLRASSQAIATTRERASEVLRELGAHSKRLPNMCKEQIIQFFSDLPREEHGRLSFYDLQKRVADARAQRVQVLSQTHPDVLRRKRSPTKLAKTFREPSPPSLPLADRRGNRRRSVSPSRLRLSGLGERRLSEILLQRYLHVAVPIDDRRGRNGAACASLAGSLRTLRGGEIGPVDAAHGGDLGRLKYPFSLRMRF